MPDNIESKRVIADNIRYYMDLRGVTATDVCDALGINESSFSGWVNGKVYPRIDKIEKLAAYFRVSKADLVDDRNAEPDDRMTIQSRKLFQTLQGATEEEIEQAIKIIEALRK